MVRLVWFLFLFRLDIFFGEFEEVLGFRVVISVFVESSVGSVGVLGWGYMVVVS